MFGASIEVLELLAERERIDAALLQKVGVFAASGEWSADGGCTPTSWLVHHGKMTSVEAARLVRNARLVHKHERTAKVLDAGDITTAHVDVMARAARHRESCFDEHEETLLDAARALPVQQFRTVARRWRMLADDVLADEDATRSMSVDAAALRPPLSAGRSASATAGASTPAATAPSSGATCTTSTRGQTRVVPISTTSSSSAGVITSPATRVGGSCSAGVTARSTRSRRRRFAPCS
jgi:hypothetical protein